MTSEARAILIEADLAAGASPVDCLKYVGATPDDVAMCASFILADWRESDPELAKRITDISVSRPMVYWVLNRRRESLRPGGAVKSRAVRAAFDEILGVQIWEDE